MHTFLFFLNYVYIRISLVINTVILYLLVFKRSDIMGRFKELCYLSTVYADECKEMSIDNLIQLGDVGLNRKASKKSSPYTPEILKDEYYFEEREDDYIECL